MSAVLVTGGAGYIGSHAVQGARAPPGTTSSSTTTCRPGHRASRGAARAIALVDGRHPRHGDACAATLASARRRRGHALRRVAARSASRSREPSGYYREQRRRHARPCSRRWRTTGVQHFVFSSTCARSASRSTTPIDETHPQRPINAYGETKLAIERALPHFERAYGIRCDRAALLQRRRRRSRRRASARIIVPRIHLIPRAIDAARRRRAARRSSATTTRRRTAPACATTST